MFVLGVSESMPNSHLLIVTKFVHSEEIGHVEMQGVY